MNIEATERDRRRMTSFRALAGLSLAAPLVLVGCSHAPEYSIFGSFFPVWIFCSVGGLVLAAGARALIARTAVAEHLAAPRRAERPTCQRDPPNGRVEPSCKCSSWSLVRVAKVGRYVLH